MEIAGRTNEAQANRIALGHVVFWSAFKAGLILLIIAVVALGGLSALAFVLMAASRHPVQ